MFALGVVLELFVGGVAGAEVVAGDAVVDAGGGEGGGWV